MLFFGASHVHHLRYYVHSLLPDSSEKLAYNRAKYVTVGGSTWKAILDHIKGKELSARNKNLGNQWADYLGAKHNALFVVVILGSNDIDFFHRTTARNPGVKTTVHMKRLRREVNSEFDSMKKNIHKVLYFLKLQCPNATMCYLKVAPRHSWGLAARILAKWVDYHIVVRLRKVFKVQELWNKAIFPHYARKQEVPMYGMLKTDSPSKSPWQQGPLIVYYEVTSEQMEGASWTVWQNVTLQHMTTRYTHPTMTSLANINMNYTL